MKKMKTNYQAPVILEDVYMETENRILASSTVVSDDTEVVSTGQEVETVDLSEFNHSWE